MAERKIKPKPTTTKQYQQRQRQLSQPASRRAVLFYLELADSSYSNDGCNLKKVCSVKMALLHRSIQTSRAKTNKTRLYSCAVCCEHVELLQSVLLLFLIFHCCKVVTALLCANFDVWRIFFIIRNIFFNFTTALCCVSAWKKKQSKQRSTAQMAESHRHLVRTRMQKCKAEKILFLQDFHLRFNIIHAKNWQVLHNREQIEHIESDFEGAVFLNKGVQCRLIPSIESLLIDRLIWLLLCIHFLSPSTFSHTSTSPKQKKTILAQADYKISSCECAYTL